MTAREVVAAIRRHYGCERDGLAPEWAVLPEFSLVPGGQVQRIDVLAVRAWRGQPKGHERHAIEVKVSRSDFLAELAAPHKRQAFEAVVHRFFFAAPAGLIRPEELPDGIGLLEVRPTGVRVKRKASRRAKPDPLPATAFVEAARRASRAEARITAASDDDAAALLVEVRARLAAAEAAVLRAKESLRREQERVQNVLSYVNTALDMPCHCGGGLLRAQRGDRYGWNRWQHLDAGVRCVSPWPDQDQVAARFDPD